MNKKEIIIKSFRIILGLVIITAVLLLLAYTETHYTRTGFVKKKAMTTNEYYFYDSKGNIWLFETEEELNPDMTIEVKMFNNNTMDDITDDIITDYQVIDSEIKIKIEKQN